MGIYYGLKLRGQDREFNRWWNVELLRGTSETIGYRKAESCRTNEMRRKVRLHEGYHYFSNYHPSMRNRWGIK